MRKYEYRVELTPALHFRTNEPPLLNPRDLETWLNAMDEQGWEFVGQQAQTLRNGTVTEYWVFRRPASQ